MAALIYVASPDGLGRPAPEPKPVTLESDGCYWFLNRYFESANLDRSKKLIDLYGDRVLEGYPLHRLRAELLQAREDVLLKPGSWRVLVGWHSVERVEATETWETVTKDHVLATIDRLLALVAHAQSCGLKLVAQGD